ncbi:MAG: hypothetical protein IJA35_02085 [Clostridia bacterium]|nr:hypothetical protein [Clostridia bacterium]
MTKNTSKRKFGDRRDAKRVRDIDSMHIFTPHLLPNRCDNEVVMVENIDMTEVVKYVERKNASDPEFKYTFFHVICAAIAKTITMRPLLNRFIAGRKVYERNELSMSFVVKKAFSDNASEALAIIRMDRDSDVSPIEQIYNKVKKVVYGIRKENKVDGTTGAMDMLTKMPHLILKMVVGILHFLDYHGWMPMSLMKEDPYYSTVFLTNLGSIKMSAEYHHLTNWGTNSFFVIVGEKKMMPFFNDDGSYEMRQAIQFGFTVDERIADGFYFAKSVKLLRYILQHPEILDMTLNASVDYEV